MKLKIQKRELSTKGVAVDVEKRTARFPFSSEFPVERYWGKEILSHAKGACDLLRFQNKANLLWNHNTDDVRGVIEAAEINESEKRGYVEVRFSKSEAGERLMQDVADGIIANVSFMYRILEMVLQKAGEGADTVAEYLATKWEPLEVSFVSIPADPTVGMGRAEMDAEIEVRVINQQQEQKPKREITVMDPIEIEKQRKADAEKARKEANERAAAIMALGERANDSALAKELLNSDKGLEECRGIFLEKILARNPGQRPVDPKAAEIGLTEREIKNYSFLRAINALANPNDKDAQELAAFEREASKAAFDKAPDKHKRAQRGLMVPVDLLRAKFQMQRDLVVGTANAGGNLVATDLIAASFIDLLRNKAILMQAGAQMLGGLVGNVAIPKLTGAATGYWIAEGSAPTESQQVVGQVTMSPKTVACWTDISRMLMLQSSIDAEMLVRNDFASVLALALDYAGLYGTGSSNQPRGVKNVSGIGTVDFAAATPTFGEIVDLETDVGVANADIGALKYLAGAAMRGALKQKEKAANQAIYVWSEGNQMNGYDALCSNQVESGDVLFGNWADVIIGMWGGFELTVDPYTNATSGTVRVVGMQSADIAVRRAESFSRGNNTL